MKKALPLILLALLPLAAAQQLVKAKKAADFATLHSSIQTSWEAGQFGACLAQTKELMALVTKKRTAAIRAALPQTLDGFERVAPKKEDAAGAAMMAALSASIGSVVEQVYRPVGDTGGQRVTITVTSDSPMLQMVSMWITNPAMLGPDAELIEYTGYKGVLQKQGNGYSLQVLIGDDLVEAKAPGREGDFLFGVLSQAVVDALAAALAK